jgi:hypothetical protein
MSEAKHPAFPLSIAVTPQGSTIKIGVIHGHQVHGTIHSKTGLMLNWVLSAYLPAHLTLCRP